MGKLKKSAYSMLVRKWKYAEMTFSFPCPNPNSVRKNFRSPLKKHFALVHGFGQANKLVR